jgi:hypothetical protein
MLPARENSIGYAAIGSAVCLLIVLTALTTFAQSGRRGSKSPPVSVPTPEAPLPEKKPKANEPPQLNLILGISRGDVFANIPPYYYDSVLESCARRLEDSRAVHLEVEPHEMMRSDAVKRAKSEKEAFVVWLELRSDAYSQSSGTNLDQIYVGYAVFEPVTGKTATQGQAYQSAYRKGGIPLPGGRNSTMVAEGRLRAAAEEAAERILKGLHIALPPAGPMFLQDAAFPGSR